MRPADLGRLLLLAALWGGSFLFMRVAAPVLGPVALIALRVSLAGLLLLAYTRATHQRIDLRRWWQQYLVIGAINSALPFVLIAFAELQLTASLAAILNATSPLFAALIAAVWLKDRLTARKLAGIALGLSGVAVLVGLNPLSLSGIPLLSIGASLLAAASYGLASVYTKARAAHAPAAGMAVGSQLAAALVLAPIVPLALPAQTPSPAALLSAAALAVLCTALAYVLYFRLVLDIGPLRALTVTFLVPLFGTFWSWAFLGEAIGPNTLVGCGVILAGTALVTGVRLPFVNPAPAASIDAH